MAWKSKKTVPKTKLRFSKLLGDLSIGKLAKEIGVTYTQLYPYKKAGANPTLLVLEQLADGLSKLKNKDISVTDLIESKNKKSKNKRK
jgi:predicted transcriptional regulator